MANSRLPAPLGVPLNSPTMQENWRRWLYELWTNIWEPFVHHIRFQQSSTTDPEHNLPGCVFYDGSGFHAYPRTVLRAIMLSSDVAVASTTVVNTAAETTLWTSTVPANEWDAGKVIKINSNGYYSAAAASDSFTLRTYINAGLVSTVTSSSENVTNAGYMAQTNITVHTSGATGTFVIYGMIMTNTKLSHAVNTAVNSIDTTAPVTMRMTIQWGAAKTGNSFTQQQFWKEIVH